VIVPKKPLPPRLYKYQPFNAQTLENLTNTSVWFSAPINLNDPYDCDLAGIDPAKLTEADFQLALDHMQPDLTPEQRAAWCPDGVMTPRFRESLIKYLEQVFDEHRADRRQRRGIACFSERPDSIVMWSHYANGHRGFCLEFDTAIKPFSTAKPVNYDDEFPSIPLNLLFTDHAAGHEDVETDLLLQAFVLTKAKCWTYEYEWRAMHMEASKLFGYGPNGLTGLYLGAAMPDAQRVILFRLLSGTSVKFHAMRRHKRNFQLSSERVTYTPPPDPPKQSYASQDSLQ
jgi:hypothetical protein